MDEEEKHSPSYLETFDAETETGIAESQEAKDDFINQQKSVNINKKTATRKLRAYLRPSFTNVVEICLNARRKKGEE